MRNFQKSLEGAWKLANAMRKRVLAEKIGELVVSRSAAEAAMMGPGADAGAGKYGKLWSQVTYQVGSRSALMNSIGRFILGGPEFRLMAQAPGIAKPAGPIGTQVR